MLATTSALARRELTRSSRPALEAVIPDRGQGPEPGREEGLPVAEEPLGRGLDPLRAADEPGPLVSPLD